MSIEKKSLISTLKTTKKANIATGVSEPKTEIGGKKVTNLKTHNLKGVGHSSLKGAPHTSMKASRMKSFKKS